MQLNNFNIHQIIFVLISISIYSINLSYAITDSVIQIYSQYQFINILTNTILFKDNVILKYKQTELHANKIVITCHKDTQCPSMIKAFGSPVILRQKQNPNHIIISAQSSVVYYNVSNNIITFTGNARIERLGSSIQSDNIIYLINQKEVQAISEKNNKTITILQIDPM